MNLQEKKDRVKILIGRNLVLPKETIESIKHVCKLYKW